MSLETPASERYMTDPAFHTIVQVLFKLLWDAQTTPSELREAVLLAAQMVEQRRVEPIFPVEP